MTAVIEAQHLSRSFDGRTVVHNASLSVAPGEITALIGPNGSGKTTLMLMLATLLRPDSGTVLVNGIDPAKDARRARATLGWMPDTLGVWPQLTVREALHTVCRMYGMRSSAAAARTAEICELTGLTPLLGQRSNTLSRGQKQRLSLARAIAHRPSVLLLDEPASGLDPEARNAQRHILTQLAGDGVAILVTSHVLDELEQLSTRVVMMRDGRTEHDDVVARSLQQASLWSLRALNPEALEAALTERGIPFTAKQTVTGTSYQIALASQDDAAALLTSLTSSGVQIAEFGTASSALEQAFLELNRQES